MTYEEYNEFCGSLPATSHVVQWGGAHVWKVGEKVGGKTGAKVFGIGGWDDGDDGDGSTRITFKVSHIAFEMLRDAPGLRPAPYLASRGFKWIQHFEPPGLSDEELKEYLMESHRIVSLGLTKKLQKQLGLNQTIRLV